MLSMILTSCFAVTLTVTLAAFLRIRRPSYHEIAAAEIHADLGAGEELLQDAMRELRRREKGHPVRDDNP